MQSLAASVKEVASEPNQHVSARAPRIRYFHSAEDIIFLGYPTIFSWEVEYADRVEISHGVGDVTGRSFTEAYVTEPGVYYLTATNAHGSVTATIELALPAPEIQSFFASGYTIREGLPISLLWEVSNAEELILEPHHEPVTDLKRIEVVPDKTTTYELVARNASGEARRSLTLTLPPPVVASFEGDSVSTEGEPIELRWHIEHAFRVTLSPGIGEVSPSGSIRVRPPAPFTTYELLAEGHSGTASATFEVVRFPIPIEYQDLDTELHTLLTMPHQTPEEFAPEKIEEALPVSPVESPEEEPISVQSPTEANEPLVTDNPAILRVQQMDLPPDLLRMEKAHVRIELRNALRKIKRILQGKGRN